VTIYNQREKIMKVPYILRSAILATLITFFGAREALAQKGETDDVAKRKGKATEVRVGTKRNTQKPKQSVSADAVRKARKAIDIQAQEARKTAPADVIGKKAKAIDRRASAASTRNAQAAIRQDGSPDKFNGFTESGESVNLDIGTIKAGGSIVICINVVIDDPFPTGPTQVCNQGLVTGTNFSNLVTDDPDVGGSADPTCTEVVGPPADFGDAPDPTYPTLLASSGANHLIVPGFFMGAGVDAEPDGQPSGLAIGDDIDAVFTTPGDIPFPPGDEDGVAFTSTPPLVTGQTSNVTVTASAPGLLNAWIDFNGDGSWTSPAEQIFTDVFLTVKWKTTRWKSMV
jgi:hypothetical protein